MLTKERKYSQRITYPESLNIVHTKLITGDVEEGILEHASVSVASELVSMVICEKNVEILLIASESIGAAAVPSN
jgi:hypothetical protein